MGVVVEEKGERAVVEITRQSACKSCQHSCGLAGEKHEIDEIEVEVDNPIGARAGDRVTLEMKDSQVIFASLTIYLIPPIFMILGYFLSVRVSEFLVGQEGELIGILGASIMFLLSFFGLRQLDNRLSRKTDFDPTIVEIINTEEDCDDQDFSL